MLKKILAVSLCLCVISSVVWADTFGTGANQITIDFVNIYGDSGNLGSWPVGHNCTFTGVNHGNYRMGKFEITNAQWTKFKAAYGTVTGTPTFPYDRDPYYTGSSVPTNSVSWYEAAQFVNWLNTSTGHTAAYKFTGTRGTSGYTLGVWSISDAGYNAANPYRNRNAFYFLPTENEWVKAAYWNGTSLQYYATKAGQSLYQGNGSNGGWNYNGLIGQPWNVGSGSQELNGTYDMMGNVWEWTESPYSGSYLVGSYRGWRGGSYDDGVTDLSSGSGWNYDNPVIEYDNVGFRVASIVPEPASAMLMILGAAWMGAKRKR